MPIKVLVADDSPTIRRRASATLTEAGYEVTVVESGEAAWALLEAGDACQVLLCDILMPGMDGYELCRRVKNDSRFSNLPVLLLRGTFEPWDQGKAENVGADGFITKPFDANVLLSTLSEVVAELVPGATPAVPAPSPASVAPTIPMSAVSPAALAAAASPAAAPATAPAAAPRSAPMSASPLDDADPLGGGADPLGGSDSPLDLGAPAPAAMPAGDDPFSLGEEPPRAAPMPTSPAPMPTSPAPMPVAAPAPTPIAAAPAPPPIAAAPAPAPVATPALAAAAFLGNGEMDDAMLDRLAAKVVARLSQNEVQKIAWEVVPDVAEALIKKRLLEIESKLAE